MLTKFDAKNKLLVKCIGRFSFIYVEFEQDQTLFDFKNLPASLKFLELLFDLY